MQTSTETSNQTQTRPIIGIMLDWQAGSSTRPRPSYIVSEMYFKTIWQAGGLPIGLPLLAEAGPDLLHAVHGVVIPGGDYPSPSRWYGDGHGIGDEHPRSELNEALIRQILAQNIPLLAICAGMQEMVAALGGLLHWRVAESLPQALNHRSAAPDKTSHPIQLEAGSLIASLTQQGEYVVNSHHSEGIKTLAGGLVASAHAPDGLIEAVELPNHPFALGVQWHPEFLLSAADKALFTGLIDAARDYQHKRAHAPQ